MVKGFRQFPSRHPWWWLAFSLVVIDLPWWTTSVWSLWSSDPLLVVIARQPWSKLMPRFSAFWITIPLGILMFLLIFVKTKHQGGDGPETEAARLRLIYSEIRNYLLKLYDETARFALGDAYRQLDLVIGTLRAQPTDAIRVLAANLLVETRIHLNNAIQPMLNAREFKTESELQASLALWCDLFNRYQMTVVWTFEAHLALGIDPCPQSGYKEWRAYDAKFIAGMKLLEQMKGCESIARIHLIRWGDEQRPQCP